MLTLFSELFGLSGFFDVPSGCFRVFGKKVMPSLICNGKWGAGMYQRPNFLNLMQLLENLNKIVSQRPKACRPPRLTRKILDPPLFAKVLSILLLEHYIQLEPLNRIQK